jgi:hypothetical protein
MKQVAMSMILVLLAVSMGMAQEDAAVDAAAAEQPEAAAEAATDDAAQSSPLDELAWMVGTWVDEGENSKITTTCSWTNNGYYLTRKFRVTVDGEASLEGTQMIGWDPIAGQIRSWTFDSGGGFVEGRWMRDGNRWLVKTAFTLAGGERASAINVITYVDQDTFRWQSTNREIGGELLPNIPEVTVVRQKSVAGSQGAAVRRSSRSNQPARGRIMSRLWRRGRFGHQ